MVTLAILVSCVLVTTTVNSQVCNNDMSRNVQHGVRLHSPTVLYTMSPTGPKQCAKECLKWTNCKSFNYNRKQLICEMNKRNATCMVDSSYLISDQEYDYYDIGVWTKNLAGACVDHSCPRNSRCVELQGGKTTCIVSECIDPPNIGITIKGPVGELAVGRVATYNCMGGHNITLKCAAGNWINHDNQTCPCKSYDDCFVVQLTSMNFSCAETKCRSMGGNLVLIESKVQQTIHMSYFKYLKLDIKFWISVTYNGQDFKWVTGVSRNSITFQHWAKSQPSGTGHCVTVNSTTGEWSSAICTDLNPFICQTFSL